MHNILQDTMTIFYSEFSCSYDYIVQDKSSSFPTSKEDVFLNQNLSIAHYRMMTTQWMSILLLFIGVA